MINYIIWSSITCPLWKPWDPP